MKPRFKEIIPDKTTCCGSSVHAQTMEGHTIDIDGDCINDGDYLVCPQHNEKVIYVFGTDWWENGGGTFDENPILSAWCYKCQIAWTLKPWSYRG